jgi:DNA-binding GntR family transcriptional regulator
MTDTMTAIRTSGDSGEGRSLLAEAVYAQLRGDIVAGRFAADERLKIADLADRYGVSANPVREALQQLRGEGFVVMEPNRGARVRRIDEDFFLDINEVEMLIEPHLTRYFVSIATDADIAELEAIQDEIEALDFADMAAHGELDTRFHRLMYDHNYNRHMVDMWWNHRQILGAVTRSMGISISRRKAVLKEHRAIIAAIKAQNARKAAALVETHVRGSSKHWVEQMRSARRR